MASSVLFLSLLGHLAWAQSGPSRDEQIVRMMYAKYDYATQLDVVSTDAMKSYAGERVEKDATDQRLKDAKLAFTLSDFKVGPLSEILDDKWANYFTLPLAPQQVLMLQVNGHDFKDGDAPKISWQTVKAQWMPAPPMSQAVTDLWRDITLKKVLEESNKIAPSGITYTRYAVYAVNMTYQGKTNTYKAIYLFGTDSNGEEIASPEDAFTRLSGAGTPVTFYPGGLLHSHLREVPILAEWLDQNKMTDAKCSKTGTADLCCVGSRCGVSAAGMQHELSIPLPFPATH